MHYRTHLFALIIISSLVGCSSNGTNEARGNISNQEPKAQVINSLVSSSFKNTVLDGSKSFDHDGSIVTYQWVQISGAPKVQITDSSSAVANFNGPSVTYDTPLTFQLTVTDDQGAVDTATVVVKVKTITLINKASNNIFTTINKNNKSTVAELS